VSQATLTALDGALWLRAIQGDHAKSYGGELSVKSYIFRVELVEEDDRRWSAGVPTLPGCSTWGHSREEALRNIRDAVEAYIRDMRKAGEEIPKDSISHVLDEPVVTIIA
jgi:predicted RNase H-like HicB family nuclease